MATPESLTRTLGPLLKWLRSKKPRAIVAEDIMHPEACLGATFLREHGFPSVEFFVEDGSNAGSRFVAGKRFSLVVAMLGPEDCSSKCITAAQALKVAERVRRMTARQMLNYKHMIPAHMAENQ